MTSQSHPVEGEWNNFVFKMIQKEDFDDVMQNFRQVFCKDEPICQIIRITESPARLQVLLSFAESILKKDEGLSFVALDKVTGKIAGIRIIYRVRSDDPDELAGPSGTELQNLVQENLAQVTEEAKIFEKYGIEEYADLLFTSVNPEYRGHGLVTEIYRRAFALMRANGISLCKSVFTSPVTYKVGVKFGFEELARRNFIDFKDGKGNLVLPTAYPDQAAVVMTLKL